MTPCTICGHMGATTPTADGLLHCCARCTPQATPCDPGPHDWHGSNRRGTWICWVCGALLPSPAISTQEPEVPKAPALDYDC
jgi:hypothetical protein